MHAPRHRTLSPEQATIFKKIDALMPELEQIYLDLHRNPELSMQEVRTAGIAAAWMKKYGFEVHERVGKTGVVALLKNGDGPVILLRADMDGLPVKEKTGLDYASQQTGTDRFGQAVSIMHACGHDFHVTWLMAVGRLLSENRNSWKGTVMAVFQPAEETSQGARAMLADGMVKRFPKPSVCLGQHVIPMPAGTIGYKSGVAMSAADSWEVKLFGRGAHGSKPQNSIDPVVMAASTVMRLQTVVSREVAMADSAVVTVGTLQSGFNENVIPDEALLRLNIRTFKENVRQRVLASVKRIIDAEAQASGAPKPPEYSVISQFPLTVNDESATQRTVEGISAFFGADRVVTVEPASGSEDFGLFGTAWNVPSVFWVIGGTDPELFARVQNGEDPSVMPVNHSPFYAPMLHPTLRTGVEAMLAAAYAWLD
ncbi:M20 family metallopeptidase [Ferrovibrio sp.]|uniref:M20 family metallopeptidase n=1 Tax=Ferrovibrio sp. TaxID=1917215 RepID=UPI000CB9A093|nr:M20 family metallopeptidase [Ferrovibrio sp.]PJI42053.1 MAG: amidohydrolase [Ferrovibrio sp.]